MDAKRNFRQEVKDWWNDNKGYIKVGITCGLLGIAYGFVKGVTTSDKLWIGGLGEAVNQKPEESNEEFVLNESNCDDPELLELVRSENENA